MVPQFDLDHARINGHQLFHRHDWVGAGVCDPAAWCVTPDWWEVLKYFAPTREDWRAGYIHPLYAEAAKKQPYLEYLLDELEEEILEVKADRGRKLGEMGYQTASLQNRLLCRQRGSQSNTTHADHCRV